MKGIASLVVILLLAKPPGSRAQDNGISVGQPKVYDNQSLTIMLDQLNTRLSQVQTIDQQSLVKALAQIQGSQEQDVSRGLSASVNAPSLSAATSSASTGGSGSGSSANVALPELLAAPSFKPDYGENPQDLLSDQVDLTYQIFNVRMLLERSVTDRMKDGLPRRQAIVSFNITVDPPKNAADAAAYVELTLNSPKGPLSLVASMPQEKTYNATSLSSSSHAFGGSAVARIVSVSYNQRKRKQIFFLYRDSDTLALERPSKNGAITVGWMFRPVLGRRSVSPGMRQMFAIIALPETDLPGDKPLEASDLQVQAKTYWLHYDRNTSTTVTSKYPGFWHWSAKPLPPAETYPLNNIPMLPTEAVEQSLGPTISNVRTFQTTSSNTVLEITGSNFFTGTTVRIGDKTFTGPQDGLFLKSSQTMVLTANSDLLSSALSAVVNGRYGRAIPLFPGASPEGIVIAKSKLSPLGPSYSTLELIVGNARSTNDLTLDSLQQYPDPIVTLNGVRVPYHADLVPTTDSIFPFPERKYVAAIVRVPNSLLEPQDNRAGIVFPLLGERWSAEDLIYDPDAVQITRMTTGKTTTLLISRPGTEFDKPWQVVLDKTYPLTDPPKDNSERGKKPVSRAKVSTQQVEFTRVLPCHDPNMKNDLNRCSLVKLVADSKFLEDYQKFALVSDDGSVQIIDLPATAVQKQAVTSPPVKVSLVQPDIVGLNEVTTVTVTGTGLDAVKQVLFEGKPLTFWKAKDGKAPPTPGSVSAEPSGDAIAKPTQLEVLLNRDITSKEGHQTFLLQVDQKTVATALITVAPAPTATIVPQAGTPANKNQ